MVLGFVAVYIVLQLVIGAWIARRLKTEDDYLVAGRGLGPLLATASVFATWFGAETCVSAAGEAYDGGLAHVRADPFGYAINLVLFGILVARPLWRAGVTTVADLYGQRFSAGVGRFVALLMIPTSVLWAGAQIRAFGTVVASTTDAIALSDGLLFGAVVTIAYTSLGGLLADAWTDLLQGGMLVICLFVLGVVALLEPGNPELLAQEILHPPSSGETPTQAAEAWGIAIFGSLFAQELAARAAANRTERWAGRSFVVGGLAFLLVGLVPVGLGLIARTTLPDLADGEMAVSVMAERHLGTIGQGVFAGALVSAILSSIDSALLAASGLLTHNLGPALGLKPGLALARGGVVVLGVAAYALAVGADSVHGLVEEASAFGTAGILVVGLAALFSRRGGVRTVYAALALGIASYGVAGFVVVAEAPFLVSVGVAAATWGIGTWLERPSESPA